MVMKKLLFLTGFLALAAGGASAQPVYSVRDVGMSNVDDSVHIRFVVVPGEKNIMPRGTLILTPVIRGTGQVLPLEPLVTAAGWPKRYTPATKCSAAAGPACPIRTVTSKDSLTTMRSFRSAIGCAVAAWC